MVLEPFTSQKLAETPLNYLNLVKSGLLGLDHHRFMHAAESLPKLHPLNVSVVFYHFQILLPLDSHPHETLDFYCSNSHAEFHAELFVLYVAVTCKDMVMTLKLA